MSNRFILLDDDQRSRSPIISSKRSRQNLSKKATSTISIAFSSDSDGTVCPNCSLLQLSKCVTLLVSIEELKLNVECDGTCLAVNDSLGEFVNSFYSLVDNFEHLKVNTLEHFVKNFKVLSETIFPQYGGSYKFLGRVLETFIELDDERKDRVIRLINVLLDILIQGKVKEVENMLTKKSLVKRNLVSYVCRTGNINSVLGVLQIYHKLLKLGIEIRDLLPPFMKDLVPELDALSTSMSQLELHRNFCSIARSLIRNTPYDQSIEAKEIVKKEFKPGCTDVTDDLYIYYNKKCEQLMHFVFVDRFILGIVNPFKSLVYDQKFLTLEDTDWRFHLADKWVNLNGELDEKSDLKLRKDYTTSEGQNSTVTEVCRLDDSDSDKMSKESDKAPFYDEVKVACINSQFTVAKEHALKYWKPVSLNNRRFDANLVGSEWPALYESVCCIVLEYNRAKKFKSRKRNEDFAKLVGKCTICGAVHTYRIASNPFDEIDETDGVR